MKILAIETATEACSVALLLDDATDGIFDVCPQQQSQQILPMIDQLLTKHNLHVSDLDAIAYGRGPGSFTGVRIATSTVQGLALGADLPVLEISTLATMAQQNFEEFGQHNTVSMIDARMGEVYFAKYQIHDGLAQLQQEECVCPPELVAEKVGKGDKYSLVGTGFEAYEAVFTNIFKERKVQVRYPNALYMLGLAKQALAQGQGVCVEDIKPVYLRDKVTWKKLPHKM